MWHRFCQWLQRVTPSALGRICCKGSTTDTTAAYTQGPLPPVTNRGEAMSDISDKVLFKSRKKVVAGELYRYTIEYTPKDPHVRQSLWVYVRNRELSALRAAYFNGPFILYVEMRPETYDPQKKTESQADTPHYRITKAGQHFCAPLLIRGPFKHSWTIDVIGEQTFSANAEINFEICIATTKPAARAAAAEVSADPFAKEINVYEKNTADVWSDPVLDKSKPLHICVLTHGLISNVTVDMLYLKEQIEEAAKVRQETVICKGYTGNVGKTEQGVRKLGRRVANWIMFELYPTYKPQSLSFVGHSLGGLVQTYAIGYINHVNPRFFDNVQLVNFITLASPLLGVRSENPSYVKLALDVGFIGKTGQDLGLSWVSRGSKSLLETLATGPTHEVLKRFKNRTLYANAVNDGIVPLRTASLLYLDWRGLAKASAAQKQGGSFSAKDTTKNKEGSKGKISKQNDEEVLGEESTNQSTPVNEPQAHNAESKPTVPEQEQDSDSEVDLGELSLSNDFDNNKSQKAHTAFTKHTQDTPSTQDTPTATDQTGQDGADPGSQLDNSEPTSSEISRPVTWYEYMSTALGLNKSTEIMKSAQTRTLDDLDPNSAKEDQDLKPLEKASVVQSSIDFIINPTPDEEFITHPECRENVIFHDREYYPKDLPPPRFETVKSFNRQKKYVGDKKVQVARSEERIARAWHNDMPWRKVLVQLLPEAHNNIIVRRRFSSAYGWSVVQHLVDNHFSAKQDGKGEDNEGRVEEYNTSDPDQEQGPDNSDNPASQSSDQTPEDSSVEASERVDSCFDPSEDTDDSDTSISRAMVNKGTLKSPREL